VVVVVQGIPQDFVVCKLVETASDMIVDWGLKNQVETVETEVEIVEKNFEDAQNIEELVKMAVVENEDVADEMVKNSQIHLVVLVVKQFFDLVLVAYSVLSTHYFY
jgi:hypothetical protein